MLPSSCTLSPTATWSAVSACVFLLDCLAEIAASGLPRLRFAIPSLTSTSTGFTGVTIGLPDLSGTTSMASTGVVGVAIGLSALFGTTTGTSTGSAGVATGLSSTTAAAGAGITGRVSLVEFLLEGPGSDGLGAFSGSSASKSLSMASRTSKSHKTSALYASSSLLPVTSTTVWIILTASPCSSCWFTSDLCLPFARELSAATAVSPSGGTSISFSLSDTFSNSSSWNKLSGLKRLQQAFSFFFLAGSMVSDSVICCLSIYVREICGAQSSIKCTFLV